MYCREIEVSMFCLGLLTPGSFLLGMGRGSGGRGAFPRVFHGEISAFLMPSEVSRPGALANAYEKSKGVSVAHN